MHSGQLIRMGREHVQQPRAERRGRFVACDQQNVYVAKNLLNTQFVAIVITGVDHHG